MFDVDWMGQLSRDLLRERTAALIAEACAWAVGLSDRPHYRYGGAGVVPSGLTLGARAALEQHLGSEEEGRLDLGDARAGSFRDALNALDPAGRLYADLFDTEVLHPFAHETCRLAADRARQTRPAAWAELADDVGEDPADLPAVLHAGEWEVPLRAEAELLVLAALADVPLLDVEAEGVSLSLVRTAESVARAAAAPVLPEPTADDLAASLFLARAAVTATGAPLPLAPAAAERLVEELLAHGLEIHEVADVLPHLPVQSAAVAEVVAILRAAGIG